MLRLFETIDWLESCHRYPTNLSPRLQIVEGRNRPSPDKTKSRENLLFSGRRFCGCWRDLALHDIKGSLPFCRKKECSTSQCGNSYCN